jgi:HlyD family secretion protein
MGKRALKRVDKVKGKAGLVLVMLVVLVGILGVNFGEVNAQAGVGGLQVEGRVAPRAYVELSVMESGPVAEVLVAEGEEVPAGGVLLRVGDLEGLEAEIAAGEYELLVAQQALDDLYLNAGVELAEAYRRLAGAEKVQALAEDRVKSLSKGPTAERLEQVYANLVLAENRLERAGEDLRKIEKRYNNRNSIWWMFLDQKDFRDILRGLERAQTYAQRRYEDALEKYEELQEPVDAVELGQAEADLGVARAQVVEAQRQVDKYQLGPDGDKVAAAEAGVRAAEARLEAGLQAKGEAELAAPLGGKVVWVDVKEGEWANEGEVVVILADDREWVVETDDLTELEVVGIEKGQAVVVRPEALPGIELGGLVERVEGLSQEKRGDVTYTVRIGLLESDPRLRWGMTADVLFE